MSWAEYLDCLLPMTKPTCISARALADGDLDAVASGFIEAGLMARQPGKGMLEVCASPSGGRSRILLSVGIHGNETAPIELLAKTLTSVLGEPHRLRADLLIVVGNLDAVAQQERYVDVDMNRLFHENLAAEKASREKTRALAIMQAAGDFFSALVREKIHLDLHTAIRASRYPSFAIVPSAIAEQGKQRLAAWFGKAGIGAVVMNTRPARTFSAYTADRFAAVSATVELGQIGRLGENDLSGFSPMQDTLRELLFSGEMVSQGARSPQVFEVAQEIVKHSNAFRMALDASVENFTPLSQGMEIAHDGERVYRVNAATEYILFPNPDVAVGQRAGLTVVARQPADACDSACGLPEK